jgi:hypothetical protein
MPTVNVKIVVDKFGGAWVTSDQRSSVGSNNLFNFTVHAGTAFTQNTWALSSANSTFGFVWAVAPDPASSTSTAQRVIIFDDSGQIAQSTDGGSTWTPKQSRASLVANDIPWLATNEAGDLTLDGTPKFDHSNNLFYPQGIGVWKANLPTVGDGSTWPAWNWVSQTAGIESLQTIDIICPPGGYVCTAQWDRNLFVIDNSSPDATPFPSTYGTRSGQATILPGQGIDWSGGTPAFLGIQSDGAEDSFSTTKGFPAISGWSRQAHHPTGPSDPFGPGGMAVSTSTSMIVVAGNLYATTDGGATAWTDVTPSGTAGAWPNGSGQTSMYVAADKVTANYYVANNGYDIYYTSNTGGSWTKVTPGFSLSTTSTNGHTIRAVPYNSKHYFFTSGASNQSIDTTNLFYRTTDGGPTWADVSNGSYSICDVYAFGFGAPSQSYPTIFIYGSVNGVLGVWASIDNCATWQKIGDQQFNGITFDVITSMNGDMNVPGVVYVALFGSGYIQLNY